MAKNVAVIKKILDQAETMGEGLTYIKEKINLGRPEEAMSVLLNTTHAFTSIEKVLQPILPNLPENSIQEKINELGIALEALMNDFENIGQQGLAILQLKVEPMFKQWEQELERVLKAYRLTKGI